MAKKTNGYEYLADRVLELVGGKENITFFTHCMTRLRFNVKDKSVVDVEEIKKVDGVLGVQWSNEQLQVIIGQKVGEAYELIAKKAGLQKEKAIDENLDTEKEKKKFSIGALFDAIAGCLTPLIPPMIGAGLIKCVLIIGELLGVLTADMPTYTVLSFVADAGFYFLPVFIGATAAKKFNTNMGLGMLIGAMMIHPDFISAVTEGTTLSLWGIPVYAGSYASSIFPAIISVYVMSYVEKFFKKHSPEFLSTIIVPFGTLMVMAPITLCILAPAGSFFGTYLSNGIIWLYERTGFIGVAVLAALYPLMIMTGMHGAVIPYMFQAFATLGYEPIVCLACLVSNINQGAACAAVAVKTKNKQVKSTAFSCSITAIIGGVTEPAMYGINVKYKKPLYAAMLGNLVGAAFGGLMKVYAYAFAGSSGIFAVTGFVGPTASNVVYFLLSLLIGFVVTFIGTMVMFKDKE
jgi:PTS system beta-glucosides-specific IIC component